MWKQSQMLHIIKWGIAIWAWEIVHNATVHWQRCPCCRAVLYNLVVIGTTCPEVGDARLRAAEAGRQEAER